YKTRMDISVLPNSNHPEKFLQLDVRMLPTTRGMFQVGAVMCSQKHWQNRVYFQVWTVQMAAMTQRVKHLKGSEYFPYLEKHITPFTLKSNIKRNPLYVDITPVDSVGDEKSKPSWTVKEYDTQPINDIFANYLKEERTAKDLDFWLEDLYTPGFDSLLKKKEAEHKRKQNCKILFAITTLSTTATQSSCVE
uniref:Major intrinsically disordered Notch2-binding receptor 1-like C-terminal domain-containing protein n=1 Tax=Mastacembelus armatus TaxID=205130 RepID=A0A3Q3NBM1_9TELE